MKNMKECKACWEWKERSEFHHSPTAKDKCQSYCKVCASKKSKFSKMLAGGTSYYDDGYATEWEHFNAALEHYAEIFDCPSLVRHKVPPRKAHYKRKKQ